MSKNSPPERTGTAFDCRQCGHCCRGMGGIVVSGKDLKRLCAHLACGPEDFENRYGQRRNGKMYIRSNETGFCIFFTKGTGCGVHVAKPDICRAWPYFRGNLVDSKSLELAKEFCPGISREQSHGDFVKEGLAYLVREKLVGGSCKDEAGALQVADLLAGYVGNGL